ncbi:DsbA family protein [Sphingomonas trueperi]|uniref:DsbA family protein n=1 Tax=Sphingomonas trueperi TaxID=53317 RepID=UPI000EB25813
MMQRLLTLMLALVPLFALGAAPAPQANWLTTVVATPEGGYRQGNPNAPVKLVEYGSRTCPTCGRFANDGMKPLRDQYVATGKVSYEYRDYLVHGAPDLALALLNQCVGTQRFFPVLDAIYAHQPQFEEKLIALEKTPATLEAWQKLPPPQMATRFAENMGMIAFLKTQGLLEAKARQCLADTKAIARIAKTQADGANLYKVDGTPSFFVNGRRVRAFTWPYLEPELRAAGA